MPGGQRRVQHTVLDGGHDGVRLHHRQESPRPAPLMQQHVWLDRQKEKHEEKLERQSVIIEVFEEMDRQEQENKRGKREKSIKEEKRERKCRRTGG
jgi:hypothetical protein